MQLNDIWGTKTYKSAQNLYDLDHKDFKSLTDF